MTITLLFVFLVYLSNATILNIAAFLFHFRCEFAEDMNVVVLIRFFILMLKYNLGSVIKVSDYAKQINLVLFVFCSKMNHHILVSCHR